MKSVRLCVCFFFILFLQMYLFWALELIWIVEVSVFIEHRARHHRENFFFLQIFIIFFLWNERKKLFIIVFFFLWFFVKILKLKFWKIWEVCDKKEPLWGKFIKRDIILIVFIDFNWIVLLRIICVDSFHFINIFVMQTHHKTTGSSLIWKLLQKPDKELTALIASL